MNSALKNPRRIMSRVRALAGACLIGLAVGAITRAAVSRTSDVMIVESPSGELPMVSDACQGGVLIFRSEVDHNGVAWAVESASVKNGRLYLKVSPRIQYPGCGNVIQCIIPTDSKVLCHKPKVTVSFQ